MRIIVETANGSVGLVVGYAPGPKGSPRAIVLFPDGSFEDWPLGQIRAAELSPKTRKKMLRKIGVDPKLIADSTRVAN